jgi:hypothetical protein
MTPLAILRAWAIDGIGTTRPAWRECWAAVREIEARGEQPKSK